jgi:hypothetical protein
MAQVIVVGGGLVPNRMPQVKFVRSGPNHDDGEVTEVCVGVNSVVRSRTCDHHMIVGYVFWDGLSCGSIWNP